MATAVVVVVILLPSLVNHCHCHPCPPPPAQKLILECETCLRGARTTTTMAWSQSRTGVVVGMSRKTGISPPSRWPLSSISGAICAMCQSWGALVGLVVLYTTLAFPSGNNFPISSLHFWLLWVLAMAKGAGYRQCWSQCRHSNNDRKM